MAELQPLTEVHAAAVLAFELANRDFFALTIADRGDGWFEQYDERFRETLADQAAGRGAFFVLVDDGRIVGRVNLYVVGHGVATLGYRLAESASGLGLATAAAREVCALAPGLGLRTVRAAAADANRASQRVLEKAGFRAVGRAGPDELGGRPGTWYERRV